MLFDEPTSSLDPELAASVLAVMRKLRDLGNDDDSGQPRDAFCTRGRRSHPIHGARRHLKQGPPEWIFGPRAQPRTRAFVAEIVR